MQKHSSDQRKIDGNWCVKWDIRWHSWERCLGDTMCQRHRHNRIREHECRGIGPKRYLVEKDDHIDRDKSPCDQGKAPTWSSIIFDRNHTFPPIALSVTSYSCVKLHMTYWAGHPQGMPLHVT